MLSKNNFNAIVKDGVYKASVHKTWLPNYKRETPYHCTNWIFRPRIYEDSIMMVDTYWSTGDGLSIELTDDNFKEFEFLFSMQDVTRVSDIDFWDYDECNRWHVALDSGGWTYNRHYYVRKGAEKNREYLLDRLESELTSLEHQIERKKAEIERVRNS